METVETAVPTVSTAFTAATDSKTKTTDKRVEASSLAARPSTKQHQSSFTAGATNVADHQLAAGFPPFLTAVHNAYTVAAEHSFALKRSGKYEAAATEFLRLDMSKGQQLISVFVNLRSARMSSAATKVAETSRAAIVASIAGALTAILPGLQSRSPWAVRFPNVCALSPHQSRMPYALISAR